MSLPETAARSPDFGIAKGLPQIVLLDGIYHLQIADGVALPMMQHNAPLRQVGDGWRFHSLYSGFAPILLFELEHSSGQRATWFFNSTPAFIANTVSSLSPADRAMLVRKATRLLSDLLAPVLGLPLRASQAQHDEAVRGFFSISEPVRLEIAAACQDMLLPPETIHLVDQLPEILLAQTDVIERRPVAISRKHVQTALREDFQARLIEAVREGSLSWPGPIDGTLQPVSAGLCFNYFAFAYRMRDRASGLTCFLLASNHIAEALGLYFPSEGLIFVNNEVARHDVNGTFPNLRKMLIDYVCLHGDTLLPSLAKDTAKQVAGSMRENHLGHQLWNELSGLESLVNQVPATKLPLILPLDGEDNAFFGSLETIFPEFSGKIRNDVRSSRAIIAYAHRNDLVLVRFTGSFVSANLRQRILSVMARTEDFQAVVARRQLVQGPIVLIGLRVENRTVVDQVGFLTHLIQCIGSALPEVLIVLDGQNSNDETAGRQAPTSFMSVRALQSPVIAEREICQQVQETAAKSGIRVEIASGRLLTTSIAWSLLANCIISFWGAGLAKYRWIANRPVLILSSRYNLENRGDLHIYDHPRFMENPSPALFADPSAIHDDMDAPQLISLGKPNSANFKVDTEIFLPQVRAFLATFISGAKFTPDNLN